MIKKFWIILKAQWQHSLMYPGMLAIWMVYLFFLPLTMLFVWKTIIQHTPSLQSKEETLTLYYILLPLISLLTSAWGGTFLAEKIRTGSLNMYLVKPTNPFIFDIANNLAEKAVKSIFLLPMIVFGGVIFSTNIKVTIPMLAFTIAALLLSAATNFLVETIVGLLGFWTEEVTSFVNLIDISKFTLGGRVIPLFLFPLGVRAVANILPFRYLAVFPLEIIAGAVNSQEMMTGFAIQFAWLAIFAISARFLWERGLTRYSAVGG